MIEVQTELGPIQFRGCDKGRPILLLITGAFAPDDQVQLLPDRFPALDVLRAHLPGNHCPRIVGVSVGIFAAAFTDALDVRFPGRDVLVVGLSVGALVAMSLRSPSVRRIVAVEPPFLSDEAWPLEVLRTQAPPGNEEFLWNILGIGPEIVERRDYRGLLDGLATPTDVIIGEPAAPYGTPWSGPMPGLLGPESRAALAAHSQITVTKLNGVGHNIVRDAGLSLLRVLQSAAQSVFGADAGRVSMPDPPSS